MKRLPPTCILLSTKGTLGTRRRVDLSSCDELYPSHEFFSWKLFFSSNHINHIFLLSLSGGIVSKLYAMYAFCLARYMAICLCMNMTWQDLQDCHEHWSWRNFDRRRQFKLWNRSLQSESVITCNISLLSFYVAESSKSYSLTTEIRIAIMHCDIISH